MTQRRRVRFSAMQRIEMWSRWKAGQSLHQIGRAFSKSHVSTQFVLSQQGGIIPAARRRSLVPLTLAEREDISRGIAGWAYRTLVIYFVLFIVLVLGGTLMLYVRRRGF